MDDEQDPLILRKMVLQRAGYEVITASSAKEALQVLLGRNVDLVLSDHLMPGTTGTELAKQVKGSYPKLPVVIVSGVNEIPSDAACADLFISKLEGPVVLSERISEVLQRTRQSS